MFHVSISLNVSIYSVDFWGSKIEEEVFVYTAERSFHGDWQWDGDGIRNN